MKHCSALPAARFALTFLVLALMACSGNRRALDDKQGGADGDDAGANGQGDGDNGDGDGDGDSGDGDGDGTGPDTSPSALRIDPSDVSIVDDGVSPGET